jgi:hypothetical protein
MSRRLTIALLIACVPVSATAAASAPLPVSAFLAKVGALKKKGPLALFSGDIKLLMNQVKTDSAQLRAENKALEAAGKPKHYCAPEQSKLSDKDLLTALEQVPVAQRPRTSTKEAFRAYLARRFPCKT